ncbi:hypothetical protein FGB62_11g370 [Gracilaria domingensis]|nr:hypothetical protein FGB62_11g370 [Gracilaria domingensis]
MCWCEKNAVHAAANVAMDEYAFQLRIGHCNVTSFIHDDIALPNSAKRLLRSTCGNGAAQVGRGDEEESCGNKISAAVLRLLRIDSLYRLQQADVRHGDDIALWSAQLDGLFAVDAWLYAIGVSFSFPRTNVKRYLLQRSTLLKGNKQVSYAAVTDIGDYSFSRFVFVQFERCTSRISSVSVQEEETAGHFKQFVYFDPADRQMWAELHSAQAWCKEVIGVSAAAGDMRAARRVELGAGSPREHAELPRAVFAPGGG